MAETGWPLIPREVLPAPVPPAARKGRAQRRPQPVAGRQLSIFGAETTEPSLLDVAGLLAGPGRMHRMGGTARVSVRVDAAWRVHVLVAELVSRGLVVTWRPLDDEVTPDAPRPELERSDAGDASAEASGDLGVAGAGREPDGGNGWAPAGGEVGRGGEAVRRGSDAERPPPGRIRFEVRTAYSSRLNALARAWPDAADQLFLSGPRLRLWVAAAGRPVDSGYALALGDAPESVPWRAVDGALRRAGLDGTLSDHGLDVLISGRKRLTRLAELVGQRPEAAPAALWPGGAAA